MRKPTESAKRVNRLPSRISRKALARMEAEAINEDKGATWMPRPFDPKLANQALLATVYGPGKRGEPAGRCYHKVRGGVIKQPMDSSRYTTAMVNRISR